jgi:hypothetical protein
MEQQNGFIVPGDILEEPEAATFNLLPAKSKKRYLKVLEKFRDWMRKKNVDVITEEVILACSDGSCFANMGRPNMGRSVKL